MELKDIIKDDWKVIDDFPRYLISNRGEVFSITSNKVLRVSINKGYAKVVLCNNATGNNKTIEVHRLVAKAFVNNPNPNEFVQVNHKDENTLNNNANNLEWCTAKYNSNYGNRNKNLANYFAPIVQVDCFNNRLRIFKNNQCAANYCNCSHSAISKCRTGRNSTCAGYKWKSPTFVEAAKLREVIQKDEDVLYINL